MDLSRFLPEDDQIDTLIEETLDKGFEAAKGSRPNSDDQRRQWMRDENGSHVLNAIPPVAFAIQSSANLEQPEHFLSDCVQLMPVVNPLFHALMIKLGAKQNGVRSYEVSAGKGKNAAERDRIIKEMTAILEVIPGSVCYSPECVEQASSKGFQSWNISRYKVFGDIYHLIRDTTAGKKIAKQRLSPITGDHPSQSRVSLAVQNGDDVFAIGPLVGAALILSSAKGRLFIKVCTNRVEGKGLFLSDESGTPDLDRLRPGAVLDPQLTTPDRALLIMEAAAQQGYTVIDPDGVLFSIRSKLGKMVVAQRIPGAPGQSRLVVGQKVSCKLGSAADRLPGQRTMMVRVAVVPAGMAGQAVEMANKAGHAAIIDHQVKDVIAMAEAKPVPADNPSHELRLRDYQRQAVGLHLATDIGYLQACSVGLGKTAIVLRGMQGWAKRKSD